MLDRMIERVREEARGWEGSWPEEEEEEEGVEGVRTPLLMVLLLRRVLWLRLLSAVAGRLHIDIGTTTCTVAVLGCRLAL